MKRPRVDSAWRLAVGLFAEVLNPLLVIWLALFVSLGYIMTLLTPMRGEHWAALLLATLALTLAGLLRIKSPLGYDNPPRPAHSNGGMNATPVGSGGSMTPLGPPVGSGGSNTPLGPPVGSGGSNTPLGPPVGSGGSNTPLGPPVGSGGSNTPLGPPRRVGGKFWH